MKTAKDLMTDHHPRFYRKESMISDRVRKATMISLVLGAEADRMRETLVVIKAQRAIHSAPAARVLDIRQSATDARGQRQ